MNFFTAPFKYFKKLPTLVMEAFAYSRIHTPQLPSKRIGTHNMPKNTSQLQLTNTDSKSPPMPHQSYYRFDLTHKSIWHLFFAQWSYRAGSSKSAFWVVHVPRVKLGSSWVFFWKTYFPGSCCWPEKMSLSSLTPSGYSENNGFTRENCLWNPFERIGY